MANGISLVCWNVWFDRLKFTERCKEIFRICASLNPDVICLQEVTPHFLQLLQLESFFSAYESSENIIGPTINRYGVLTLCKRDLQPQFISQPYRNTEMGRSLLISEVTVNDSRVSVCTTHLESLDSASYRRDQLLQCRSIFSGLPSEQPIILCGDFNFCSYRNFKISSAPLENDVLSEALPHFIDVWPLLHEEDRGYTFDSTRNNNINQEEVMRYDRVVCDGKGWLVPSSIEIIGTDPLEDCSVVAAADAFSTPPPKQPTVYPSDHFGLYVKFCVNK